MILNSFRYARISSELDRSEHHQFRVYQDLEKGNETIELENEEALDQENGYKTSSRSNQ